MQSYKSKTNYKNQCEMQFERTISSIERIINQLWIDLTDDETIKYLKRIVQIFRLIIYFND